MRPPCFYFLIAFSLSFPIQPMKYNFSRGSGRFSNSSKSRQRSSSRSPPTPTTPTSPTRPASYVTSTPSNRQSAPNLSSMLSTPIVGAGEPASSKTNNDLTAEIDLSDDLGVTPIHDSHEDTPMFTPRTNSRIVRIISKQSNV